MSKKTQIKLGAFLLAFALVFGVLTRNYIPEIYGMPAQEEDAEQVVLLSAGQALAHRMNEIQDEALFSDVGRYVYEVVSAEESAAATDESTAPATADADFGVPENESEAQVDVEAEVEASEPEVEAAADEDGADAEAAEESEQVAEEVTEEAESEEATEVEETVEEDVEEDVEAGGNQAAVGSAPVAEPEQEQEEEPEQVYPWDDMTDDEFGEFIFNKKNKALLTEILENDQAEENKALYERVNLVEDNGIYRDIQQHIYALLNPEQGEVRDAEEFPWQGMTDEEFAEWITGGEHNSYIIRILSGGQDDAPESALADRVKDMADAELAEFIRLYLEKLNGDKPIVDEEEAAPVEGEEPAEDVAKATYPWDSMTDDEFADWILSGANNEFILEILRGMLEEEEAQLPKVEQQPEVDIAEQPDAGDALSNDAQIDFNERVEAVEDETLLGKIKGFLKELVYGKPELILTTLVNEANGIKVEGMLPEGATLKVERIAPEQVAEFVGEGKEVVFAYDISIFVDGVEYQPEQALSVSVLSKGSVDKALDIKHIAEDDETGEKTVETVKSSVDEDGAVTFSAESFSIYMAIAETEEIEYIYFDLLAGNVSISNSTYTGYIYSTTDGVTTTKNVKGTHSADNRYYVYQSPSLNCATTGEVEGVMTLPEYAPVEYNGAPWAEYITNNTDVEAVIDAWKSAVADRFEIQNNYISISVAGKSCDLTIDNIYTMKNDKGTGRLTGGIAITGANTGNTHVTVRVKGDNRLGNIFYCADSADSSVVFTSASGDASNEGTLTVIGRQNSNLSTSPYYKVSVGPNFWTSVIGGSDNGAYENAYGLTFRGATVYAGSTPIDNCTAIGGGGNGMGNVIIEGGTITAVAHTTGTAIGGGIAHTSYGGTSDVQISGGKVYAYNFGQPAYWTVKDFGSSTPANVVRAARHVAGTAIGGGSSIMERGNKVTAKVAISGGYVYAESLGGCAIGGGNSVNKTAGDANITISGGTVIAKSSGNPEYCRHEDDNSIYSVNPSVAIGGGRGGINGDGGSATVKISGDAKITTGSVGGGGTIKPNGAIGYAEVNISGGTTSGQFVMAQGATKPCTFTMTGGLVADSHADDEVYARIHKNGGAVYMDDSRGVAEISGGTIKNCSAVNGGAVYMTDGTFTISGTGEINNCTASGIGGAVCIGDGDNPATGAELNVDGGAISQNSAINGGGIALFGGEVKLTAGEIKLNRATDSGGGAYVNGGNAWNSGASITNNTAIVNGGGMAVSNGNVVMSGGKVDNNSAGADGGGIYVASSGSDVSADVLSGTISGNTSAGLGGALAVVGRDDGTESISVTIGVNELHASMPFEHNHKGLTYNHAACPEIKNNKANTRGGAVYLSGGAKTDLYIYCVYEEKNMAYDGETEHNFIMMEGGNCNISSSRKDANGNFIETDSGYGNVNITGTAYIIGGNMDIWGVMGNPSTAGYFTVNILADENGNKGYFKDHRPGSEEEDDEPSVEAYRIHYFENFKGSGKYKTLDIPAGETVTISGTIYSHPGYKILGWYTNPDGTGDEYPVNSVFDPATFVPKEGGPDHLIIYAKWEANNYHVEFEANPPEGMGYGGTMEPMSDLEFDKEYVLNPNAFTCTGYVFVGWNTEADGSGDAYANNASIKNLTDVKGEMVKLYAQWDKHVEPPEDPDEPSHMHIYTYSVEGSTLVRTCMCGIINYATLTASDTTYDGTTKYQAKIEYSANNSVSTWEPVLHHPENPVDAGTYTAYVQAGDGVTRAEVTYVINKADQPAPPVPVFNETIEENRSGFVITPVDPGKGKTLYRLVYSVGDETTSSPWSTSTTIEIPNSLTNYHVEVKYAGTENYNESPVTRSKSVFYAGKARIEVTAEQPITCEMVSGESSGVDSGVDIIYSIPDGYHKKTTFNAAITNPSTETSGVGISHNEEGSKFHVSSIPNADIVIKIHVSGVERDTVIIPYVTEGQVFSAIDGSSASISRDSAFSAYYSIGDYNSVNYGAFMLEFSQALPVKSTVILIDKSGVNYTYWYYEVGEVPVAQLPLTAFTSMGGFNAFTAVSSGDADYQFVVDFSKTDNGCPGSEITMSLLAPKISDNQNVKLLEASVTAALGDTGFDMTVSPGVANGMSGDAELEFLNEDDVIASKWEKRRSALVLATAGELPPDARITLVRNLGGGQVETKDYYLSSNDSFILPVGFVESKSLTATLASDMLPSAAKIYAFNCKWIVSDSMAGASPVNGDVVAEKSIALAKGETLVPSVDVTSADNGKQIYGLGETIKVNVDFENITNGMGVKATLMFKNENGQYESFGLTQNVLAPGVVSMSLSADTPGNYSVLVEVENDKGFAILKAPYYFMVQRK